MRTHLSQLLFIVLICTGFVQAEGLQSKIEFTKETLDNGLRVIYAPLKNAPVVHVRVMYFVGSRDEDPNRQGFAHMFEHMMFRGSRHVAPELHMKLIGDVGGDSNAFTSFDQTTYTNTLPSNNTEMALYLEADRMASFKVNDEIFQTERKVVAEEWRMRYANQPLGSAFQDLLKTAFTTHSYRWTPIGDMQQLSQATSSELQTFFNTYYVPNNACLVIAGDFDEKQTREWVKKYFGWIPQGPQVVRKNAPEPKQTDVRRRVVAKPNIPLTNIYMAFKTPEYRNDDHDALNILGEILSSGRTGRLDRALVYNDKPLCVGTSAGNYQLFDPSIFAINAVVQQGENAEAVETEIVRVIHDIKENGITQQELDKVRTQIKQQTIRGRQECDDIARQLSEEEIFGGDAARVNDYFEQLDALKPEHIQRVAKTYLDTNAMSVVRYEKGTPTTQPANDAAKIANDAAAAGVKPSDHDVAPRVSDFPEGYPTQPPINRKALEIVFNKGVEAKVEDVKVITLTDHRLPLVNATMIFRSGSHIEPEGKEGVADLTAQMLRRGSGDLSLMELSQDLESRGISVEISDNGDHTRLRMACTTDQLDYAVSRANLILSKPTFPVEELDKLKRQAIGGLMQSLSRPGTVLGRVYNAALFAHAPQSRVQTPQTLASITIDDIKKWYELVYSRNNALIVISGDVTPEQGTTVAAGLLKDFVNAAPAWQATYKMADREAKRQIILVDNPQGKQSTIRVGVRAYELQNPDKFAGSVAGQILSSGIDSRLGKYVRAEKGLTYGVYAYFRPTRSVGEFSGSVDTNPQTTAEAVEAMFKVFKDMRTDLVTPEELAEAKMRTSGGMAMEVQTIAQQAGRRVDQILNNYPIDYYDKLPEKINAVTAEQVREVMNKYVKDDQMLIVVVAPASEVKTQLEKLGEVTVVPMPLATLTK